MTTDFTSATILGTKNTTTEKLSFSTQKNIDKNNMFDSLLTNVTKSYTSKDITKLENHFATKEYAAKTKDINSAKNHKAAATEKTTSADFTKNTSTQEKKAFNTKKEIENNNITKKENETSTTEIETSNKNEFDKDTCIEKESDSVELKENVKTETNPESEVDKDNSFAENNNQDNNPQNEQKENQEQNEPKQDPVVETENTASENSNKIINEQILANIEVVESVEKNTNLVAETIQIEKIAQNEQQTTTAILENTQTARAEIQNEVLLNSVSKNQETAQINAPQTNIIQEALTRNTNSQKVVENIVLNDNTNLLQNTELEINSDFIQKSLEKGQVIKDVSQQVVQEIANQNNTNTSKTVQENLAADNARITLNIENDIEQQSNSTQIQEKVAITPANTIEETSEIQIPTIKVTEEVATQVEANLANLSQNKDYAGEIKSKAAAKLGELQGTSTVVTEVQTSAHTNSQNQSQTNLGQNNNTSIQNNATEQIAKLSVEDATTSADSFLSKLEAKINGTSKVANAQNTTLNKSDIMSQMNAKFNEMQQAGQNKVSIILQPENLGKVSVEIMNSKDGIVAKMTTDNQQVKELFDKNVEALKTSLSAQGVNVNSIKVECTHESSNNTMNFEREQFNQNFNNSSNNNNNQTHHSNNSEVTYSTEYNQGEEETEELETTNEIIKNTETIIKHDGKVDYKV